MRARRSPSGPRWASSTSGSAPSTARTRPSTPPRRSSARAATGASSASRSAGPPRSRRSRPQDGLFSVVERGPEEDDVTVYSTVRDVLLAPQRPGAPRRGDRRPRRARGHADRDRAGLPARPRHRRPARRRPRGRLRPRRRGRRGRRSASSRAGSRCARRRGEAGPLTVVSCDNLPRNGEVLARLVRDFCARLPERGEGGPRSSGSSATPRFPSTMVDRVVPGHHARRPRGGGARGSGSRTGRGRRRAVPPVGDRGRLRRPAPRVGPRRRAARAGQPGPTRRSSCGCSTARTRCSPTSAASPGRARSPARGATRRSRRPPSGLGSEDLEPTLPEAPGIDIADYRAELGRRWINPRIAPPARADRRRRLAEAARALRRARAASGSRRARRRAGSRSCSPPGRAICKEPDGGLAGQRSRRRAGPARRSPAPTRPRRGGRRRARRRWGGGRSVRAAARPGRGLARAHRRRRRRGRAEGGRPRVACASITNCYKTILLWPTSSSTQSSERSPIPPAARSSRGSRMGTRACPSSPRRSRCRSRRLAAPQGARAGRAHLPQPAGDRPAQPPRG